jgi:hypothetical protein
MDFENKLNLFLEQKSTDLIQLYLSESKHLGYGCIFCDFSKKDLDVDVKFIPINKIAECLREDIARKMDNRHNSLIAFVYDSENSKILEINLDTDKK